VAGAFAAPRLCISNFNTKALALNAVKMESMESHPRGQTLSSQEINVLITIERFGAGCSMVAIILLLLSFALFKKLRTTPNLFLVFASIANAGASVASMIGYDGLQAGESSNLCQAQAFIFEWY
jgi:hypothetical protein